MTRLNVLIASLILILASCSTTGPDLTGNWAGDLVTPGGDMRIVLHIDKDTTGAYIATMDSPDQGAEGIPVNDVKITGDSVRISVNTIGGLYLAEYRKSGDFMDGRWEQGGHSFDLDLKRVKDIGSRKRPQEPKPPFPYEAREVSFVNDVDHDTLAGTLTLPKGRGPWPAIILISGSGPQDRNEELMSHKPFLVLADYFTRNGHAVLRYDDRGFGESTGNFETADSRDFARDVLAALKFLRAQPEITPKRVGLIGHSEGGIIAPMVAQADKGLAFIILLAGPAMRGEDILYQQNEAIYRQIGVSDSAMAFNYGVQQRFFSIVLDKDTAGATERLMEAAYDVLDTAPKNYLTELGYSEEVFEVQLPRLNSPWFRYFLSHDPGPVLRFVDCPILALYGGKDLQVLAEPNAFHMQLVIARDSSINEVKVFPEMNHLFQKAKTGSMEEYGRTEETISEEVMEYMLRWMRNVE